MAQATVFIYALNCPTTGQTRYVGKSVDPAERFQAHILRSSEETNHRANWIRSLADLGHKPVLEILDEVPEPEWQQWEVAYIEYFRERGCDLVNGTPGGEDPPSNAGKKLSPKHCAAISAGQKGKTFSTETRAKISATLAGRKLTPEHCAAMSAAITGRTVSPETRAKMSAAQQGEKHHMFGKKLSQEHIAKLRGHPSAMRGKKHSPEARAKMSAARRGVKPRPGTGEKISAALKGVPKSPEHNLAVSRAKKGISCPWSPARWEALRRFQEKKKDQLLSQ